MDVIGTGVSHDSEHIIVSDGSSTLMFWDPENPGRTVKTLKVTGVVGGRPVRVEHGDCFVSSSGAAA